jgi:hypothetical protein
MDENAQQCVTKGEMNLLLVAKGGYKKANPKLKTA